jgi:hypothetical protein
MNKIYANCVIRHVMIVMANLIRIVLVVHHKDILMIIKILVILALNNVQLVWVIYPNNVLAAMMDFI